MKRKLFFALLLALALLTAGSAYAKELHIRLTGTLNTDMRTMGVNIADFTDPAMARIEPVWDENGILQIWDQGYSGVECLGCEMQLDSKLWRFPADVSVSRSDFYGDYWFSVFYADGTQEWYYENDRLAYVDVQTRDGGRVSYSPTSDAFQVAYVENNKIYTGLFTEEGSLVRYYVEKFSSDTIETVCYTTEGELYSFSVTDRHTGTEYAFGGNQGWFEADAFGEYTSCAAPEGFEDMTIAMIERTYPPVEMGGEPELKGSTFNLSSSTMGSMGFSLGDKLKISDGSTVKTMRFSIDASLANRVATACITLEGGSFIDLLVLTGSVESFNPVWISMDATSGVRAVQLENGTTMSYEEFLYTLR